MTPELEPYGPYVSARRGDTTHQVADCSVSPHGAEYARMFAASRNMLSALEEVLKTPGLQSGVQAMCAAAVAKATGRDVADVIKGA